MLLPCMSSDQILERLVREANSRGELRTAPKRVQVVLTIAIGMTNARLGELPELFRPYISTDITEQDIFETIQLMR